MRQFYASEEENIVSPYDSSDPLAEERFSATPFLIHRYPKKVLWLTTQQCAAVCRYCFRKHRLGALSQPTVADTEEACLYLRSHSEIEELLLSGGDPLMLNDTALENLLQKFSESRSLRFRLCTRMPIVSPTRITDALTALLCRYPMRVSVHINCCDELTREACAALEKMRRCGLEILTQTVLLKGVNDSQTELAALFEKFLQLRLTPYYLFQGDLAAQTAAFRVSIQRGRKLYRRVCRKLRGKPVPRYAVDLPDGGGKVLIESKKLIAVRGDKILFCGEGGELFAYPIE